MEKGVIKEVVTCSNQSPDQESEASVHQETAAYYSR